MPKSPEPRYQVAVIMTCHDRKDVTLSCLAKLRSQRDCGLEVTVYLTDDGSTDGTSEAVMKAWPGIHVLPADGSLYWAGGMALAEDAAWRTDPDYLVWLNDDTILDEDALARLLAISERWPDAIVVGSTREPGKRPVSYGGFSRPGRHPQRLLRVEPEEEPRAVDTFNGNCVLVPASVRRAVGPIDGSFTMECADIDYGFRASEKGHQVLLAPGTIGTCDIGERPTLSGGPLSRWRQLNGHKGVLPWRSQARFLKRHSGLEWPLYFTWGYVKRLSGMSDGT